MVGLPEPGGRARLTSLLPQDRQFRAAAWSDVSERRRKDDYDDGCPRRIDRQVVRLPPIETRERPAAAKKADVEHGGPRKIAQDRHARRVHVADGVVGTAIRP